MLALLLPLVIGCTSDNSFHSVPDAAGSGDGSITGRVCDPELRTWLEGAIVYTHLADTSGFIYDTRVTTSDGEGRWTLEDLGGPVDYEVYVVVDNLVVDSFLVHLEEGADVVMDDPSCFEDLDLDVAVVSGDYDDFEGLLERIGVFEYDAVNGQTGEELIQFLASAENLSTYDVIFFNGGHLEEDVFYDVDGSDTEGTVQAVADSLTAYVKSGGMLYASDWSYDVVEGIWPDKIDFLGDDEVPDAAQKGETGTVTAAVTNPGIAGAMGEESLNVLYDLAVWPPVEGVADDVTVYLTGDADWRDGEDGGTLSDSPLLMSFKDGQGLVVYSTYRNESNSESSAFDALRYLLDLGQQ